LIEQTLTRFRGPDPKRLIIHFIFSLAGGTGSAAALPIAALTHDAGGAISRRLAVKAIAHVISPNLFISRVDTPAEIERTMANAAMTLRELKLAQRPGGLDKFCGALHIAPLGRPLFDEISFYDQADCGSRVHDLEEIQARLATNIVVATNQSLEALVGARDLNPFMAQRGVGADEQGTAVIKSEHAAVLRAPVAKLTAAHATAIVNQELRSLNRPTERLQVNELMTQHLPTLGLDSSEREAHEELRSACECALPATLGKLRDTEVLSLCQRVCDHWHRRGRSEMARKAAEVAGTFELQSKSRTRRFIDDVARCAHSLPELAAVLRDALDAVEEKRAQARRHLEALASKDTEAEYRSAAASLQRALWFLPHRRRRERLGLATTDLVARDLKQFSLKLFADHVLAPMHACLTSELERTEHLAHVSGTLARQLETQFSQFQRSIGHANAYYQEIVESDEVPKVLKQLAENISARMGAATELRLAALLATGNDGEVANLVHGAVQAHRERAQTYCNDYLKDIAGFAEHFGLATQFEEWLDGASHVVLPSSLNLAFHGPGNAPLRGYVAAAPSLRSTCLGCMGESGSLNFEFCEGDDPFEIVVRAKISQAPFTAIPGLEGMERSYREFLANAPKDHIWGVLISHGALEEAFDETLLDIDGPRTLSRVESLATKPDQGDSPTN
jgi:hypothetical protein